MTPDEAWELIEQDMIPSARENASKGFRDLLARIWDQGYEAGIDDESHNERGIGPHDYATNPYRASETA